LDSKIAVHYLSKPMVAASRELPGLSPRQPAQLTERLRRITNMEIELLKRVFKLKLFPQEANLCQFAIPAKASVPFLSWTSRDNE
jgi:hypothetical protein